MNKPNPTRKAAEQRRRARVRREERLSKKRIHAKNKLWSGAVYFEACDQASVVGGGSDWRAYWLSAARTVMLEHPEAVLSSGMRSAGGYKGVNEAHPHLFKEPEDVFELDEWDLIGKRRAVDVPYQMVVSSREEWEKEYGHRTTPKAEVATATTEE